MYGKHRAILRSELYSKSVVVAGKATPERKGGTWHPMGYWEHRDGYYTAYVRTPEQWYQPVSRRDLGHVICAANKKDLCRLVLAYYDEVHGL